MFSSKIFQKRLLLLRTSHHLSNSGLSDLLGLKSRTSISNLEAGHILPSVPVLNNIADLFCISIDWLTGRTTNAYDKEILRSLEQQHIDRILLSETNSICDFALAYIKINPTYLDQTLREQYFTLPMRANIIFLLNKLKLETERFIALDQPFKAAWNNFDEFKTHALPSLLDGYQFFKRAKNNNIAQLEELFSLLEKLLITREIPTPIFDISIEK